MVYKNGIKEILLLCCISGLFYGFFMGIIFQSMKMGIISGVIYTIPFTLFMIVLVKILEKKSQYLREEISKVRKIICEGPANHKKGNNAIGGWLFLSEDAIEFYPHKMNFGGENIPILIDDITSVETKANQLKIHTKTGNDYIFRVNKAKLWKKSITEVL